MLRVFRLALVALALLAACGGSASKTRPSVVLVLVDQLRADCSERWMDETRALAARGVRIEGMRSVAPWTYPSVISLFSGLYPQQHGADANQDGTRLTTIDAAVPLLPRILGQAGYHTAAFVTNPFLHEWNTPVRGAFEHFDAGFIGSQGPTRGHGELVWTERMWGDSVEAAVRAHYDGRALDRPEFTYVHLIDVHGRTKLQRWKGAPFAPTYEAAVRFVDARIRSLYDYFLARYGDELLFVVTSDHGQSLSDDLEIGAGPPWWRLSKASLHDFNLRIPLYVLPGRDVPVGAVLAEPCANIDVAPTLLAWLGLAPLSGSPGVNLLPALRGADYDGVARALYARNSTGGRSEECVVRCGFKLMRFRSPEDGTVLASPLYDLGADPRETRPLERAASLEEALLDALAATQPRFEAILEELDPALLEDLNELGYGGK